MNAFCDTKPYSQADLDALAAKENWSELWDHLGDIRPTERDQHWNTLAERTTKALFNGKGAQGKPASLESFERCFNYSQRGGYCVDVLLEQVRQFKQDSDFATKAGRLVAKRVTLPYAVPFFEIALSGKDHSLCSDDTLKQSVIAAIAVEEGQMPKSALNIAENYCWGELKNGLVESMGGGSVYYKKNACPLLMKKGVLKGLMEKYCKSLATKT
jgi:hypothetical protein